MNVAVPRQRARTNAQKEHRRESILIAAGAHFVDAGFEKFSMAVVGKLVGLSKGTLYLYFNTREEILLALSLDKLQAWSDRLIQTSSEWTTDQTFVDAYYESATSDEALLSLLSRLDSVIEHNVTIDRFIEAKRTMAKLLSEVTRIMVPKLNLTEAQSFETVSSLGSLLLGSVQADLGPRYQEKELPEDVRQLINAFSSHTMFVTNGCRILAGIRAGV